jgi:hypothetical protein
MGDRFPPPPIAKLRVPPKANTATTTAADVTMTFIAFPLHFISATLSPIYRRKWRRYRTKVSRPVYVGVSKVILLQAVRHPVVSGSEVGVASEKPQSELGPPLSIAIAA